MRRKIYKVGIFTTTKKRSDYKTDKGYLRAVYRQNKERIDKAFEGVRDPKKAFVQTTMEYYKQGKSTGTRAIYSSMKKVGRTQAFTPPKERFVNNLMSGMKTFGVYEKFMELNKDEKGHYRSIDKSKMEYVGNKLYLYDNKVYIYVDDSPKAIYVYKAE